MPDDIVTPEPEEVQDDFLDISDEDFLNLPEPIDPDEPKEEPLEEDPPEKADPPEEDEDTPTEADEDPPVAEEGEDPEPPETEEKEPSDDSPAIDYKAEYEKLMAPFKANGHEMTPQSVEDAKRLQQMGANYHKKMAGMKPAIKALKTLENNGLLDEGKLDYLIELYQGKPEAITQLLKDSKIDPLDVDVTTETPYTPANHSVSDAEVALDSVLEDIKESPSYTKTLTTVTKEWDEASRAQAATNPQIISVINGHMDTGVYDKVMAAVNYDRSIGKLGNMSDLDAYKETGNRLEQEGAFAQPVTPATDTGVTTPPSPQSDPVKEQKRQALKKAASPTKTSPKISKLPSDFNPLDLSDEEFAKFDPKKIGL
jgi:hypothetical protein